MQCLGLKPLARFNHTATVHHEQLFVFAGEDQYGQKLKDVHMLNLENYEWSEINTIGDGPSVRSLHSACVYKNSMIIFGGERGGSGGTLNDCYMLNLDTNAWSVLTPENTDQVPTPRYGHSAAVHGNQMFIYGGMGKFPHNDLFMLDIDKKHWTKLHCHSAPHKRFCSDMFIRGGTLVMIGGFYEKDSPLNDIHALKIVDETSKSLISTESIKDLIGGKKISFGALKAKEKKNHQQILSNLTWVCLHANDEKLKSHFFRSFCHQGKIYMIGGEINGQQITQLFETDLDTYQKIMNVPYSEITIEKKIGEGTFRDVYKGYFRGEHVCIKVLKGKDREKEWQKYILEIDILRQLKHPNVLGFRAVCSTDPNYCLVTELAEKGDLFGVLRSKDDINLDQKLVMSLDIARGLQYLHSQNPPLIHGNLSSKNLLVTPDYRIKISDFFLSVRPFNNQSLDFVQKIKLYGSPYYMAPEVLAKVLPNKMSDIYSLGVVFWEIYIRKDLFDGDTAYEELGKKIIHGHRPIQMEALQKLIDEAKDDREKGYLKQIKYCWASEGEDRPQLESIIKALKEMMSKISKVDSTVDRGNLVSAKYETIRIIGHGGQAIVYLVKEKSTGKEFALKRYNEAKVTFLNEILQEMRTYVSLTHPNIVAIRDFYLSDITKSGLCNFNIIMDFCDGGDLSHNIKIQTKHFPNDFIRSVLTQLLDGMRYIHSRHIIHRDLKAQNIFLMKNTSQIKIGDLGLAREITDETKTYVGTINYMSPEQRAQKPYDFGVDIWGIGTILFELLTLKNFEYPKYMENKKHYLDENFKTIRNHYDTVFFEILEECLTVNPDERPSAEALMTTFFSNMGSHTPCLTDIPSSPRGDSEYETTLTSTSPPPKSPTYTISSNDSWGKQPLSRSNSLPVPLSPSVSPRVISAPFPGIVKKSNVPELDLGRDLGLVRSDSDPKCLSTVYRSSDVLHWSMDRVGDWLVEMNLEQYKPNFDNHAINGEALLELGDFQEFVFMDIKKVGHIKILQKYIRAMQEL